MKLWIGEKSDQERHVVGELIIEQDKKKYRIDANGEGIIIVSLDGEMLITPKASNKVNITSTF